MAIKKNCPYCTVELTTPGSISYNVVAKHSINEARVFCFTRAEKLEEDTLQSAEGAVRMMDEQQSPLQWMRTNAWGIQIAQNNPDHCTWTGKLIDAEQHFKQCGFAGVRCGFGCGAIVTRKDMIEHEASACQNRAVLCTNLGCTDVMPHPMIASHKANDCLYQKVSCCYRRVGCNVQLLRKDINKHVEASANQHMLLIVKQVSEHEKVNRWLQQENQDMQQKITVIEQDKQSMQQQIAGLEERLNKQEKELAKGMVKTEILFLGGILGGMLTSGCMLGHLYITKQHNKILELMISGRIQWSECTRLE